MEPWNSVYLEMISFASWGSRPWNNQFFRYETIFQRRINSGNTLAVPRLKPHRKYLFWGFVSSQILSEVGSELQEARNSNDEHYITTLLLSPSKQIGRSCQVNRMLHYIWKLPCEVSKLLKNKFLKIYFEGSNPEDVFWVAQVEFNFFLLL